MAPQAPPGRREALPAERSAGSARQEPSKRVKKELRLPKTGIEPVSNSYKGFVLTVKLFRLLFFFLFLVLFRPIWGPERRNTQRSALPWRSAGKARQGGVFIISIILVPWERIELT